MQRSLKIYIFGVVTASVVALAVATFVFPVESRIALTFTDTQGSGQPTELEFAAGIGFWILLILVTSGLPVALPRGTQQAV